MRLGRRREDREAELSLRPISNWMLLLAVVAVAVAGGGLTWWLLSIAAADPHPSASVRIDAIRTGLSAAVGTGGAFALLLAFRRQRSTEVSTVHTITDAAERRVTELYTKAADQLGSEKAPVRLAGLYALERLAQDSPGQRQTIVNVICAYLQMPYTPPGAPPAPPDNPRCLRHKGDGPEPAPEKQARVDREYERYEKQVQEHEKQAQEHRVRTTAQRILSRHLSKTPANEQRWHTAVDLSGAYLAEALFVGTDFSNANLGGADLSGAILSLADLTGAILYRANLSGADLSGADLTGADLGKASWTDETIWSVALGTTIRAASTATETAGIVALELPPLYRVQPESTDAQTPVETA